MSRISTRVAKSYSSLSLCCILSWVVINNEEHVYIKILYYILILGGDTCVEQKSNRREFVHTRELLGDGRTSEQLTLAQIHELYSLQITGNQQQSLFRCRRERVKDTRAGGATWWWWWWWLSPRLTSLLSIGYVVCSPLATWPIPLLWAGASATITEFNHVYRSRWYSDNNFVDTIFCRMQLSKHPSIHSICEHGEISAITFPVISPILSMYLSKTPAVLTPVGQVNILQLLSSSFSSYFLSLSLYLPLHRSLDLSDIY